MPMYVYACPACGHKLEQLAKHDAPAPVCPSCTAPSPMMEKQLTAPSCFDFRGGGFYANGA